MSEHEHADEDAALAEWVDEAADRFEVAWRSLAPPRIADFLGEATGAWRLALLEELVKLDVAYRNRLGRPRPPSHYLEEFPELRERATFRTPPGPAPAVDPGAPPPPPRHRTPTIRRASAATRSWASWGAAAWGWCTRPGRSR
jgi:hypothetical protein